MKNSVNNTVLVKTVNAPKGVVSMKDVRIDIESNTFSLMLKEPNEKRFKKVEGIIDRNLNWFMTTLVPDRVKVVDETSPKGFKFVNVVGQKTKLERLLRDMGVETNCPIDAINKLSELRFDCDNESSVYQDNPFRLYYRKHDQKAVLCPIHIRPAKKVVTINPDGSEEVKYVASKTYTSKSGKTYPAYLKKDEYKRLVIEDYVSKEVFN